MFLYGVLMLTTPHVSDEYASVRLLTTIANDEERDIRIVTEIILSRWESRCNEG